MIQLDSDQNQCGRDMAFELPAWLNQSNTDLIPNAIAKGTQAGATIASGIRANRQQGLDERQRAISNDLRQRQTEALMDVREAQAAAARAKLDQAAAYAAEQKQGWDTYHLKMSALDEANKGDPEWNSAKRAQASEDVMFELSPQLFAGQPAVQQRLQSAKMMNDTRRMASEEATARAKIGASSRETVADIGAASREKIAAGKDNRTVTQKNTQALVEAESAARMARGDPPFNPAEETARKAEVLGGKVTGKGKQTTTAAEENLATAEQLKKDFEVAAPENRDHAKWMFESFSRMAHITSDSKQSVEQKLKVADALGQIRALRANDALFNKPGASQVQIDAIIKQFSGDPAKPSASEPSTKFKFEFKGDRLQSVK